MSKAVVYTFLATAFLLFIVFSSTTQKGPNDLRLGGRRLKFKLPTFDPLLMKIEGLAEQAELRDWSSSINADTNHFSREVGDAYEYFTDEGKLNITLRLVVLFPFLDKTPKDGVINFKELEAWNIQQATDRLSYRTQKELVSHDKDGDGAITFREYLNQLSDEDIEKNGIAHGEAGWWKEQFINADSDRNGSLSFDEFKDFLHPEDSNNDDIQRWLLGENIKRMDYDNDGKLNFVEFHDHAYDTYKNYVEFDTGGTDVPKAEEKFEELDVNKDKFLVEEELKPILNYLHPGELSYARYYTNYLIHEADDNGDGNLTLDEMLNHEHIFYSTVYDESKYEDDDDDDFHDEL